MYPQSQQLERAQLVEEEEEEEIDKDSVEEDITWRSSRTSRRRSSVGVESTYTATTTDNDSCSLNLDSVVEDESSSIYTTSAKMTTSSTVEALRVSQLLSIYKNQYYARKCSNGTTLS